MQVEWGGETQVNAKTLETGTGLTGWKSWEHWEEGEANEGKQTDEDHKKTVEKTEHWKRAKDNTKPENTMKHTINPKWQDHDGI